MSDSPVESIVETLTRLGLSTYEARTFVALHRLGAAPAGDIAEVAEVPRSQVYGAAERLEARGLIHTQQGTPTQFRPVPLEEARTLLLDELEAAGRSAFSALESRAGELEEDTERTESIWVIEGAEQVADRTARLVETADERLRYGIPRGDFLEAGVLDALHARAEAGVSTLVVSTNPMAIESIGETSPVQAMPIPGVTLEDLPPGRTLLVDDRAVLLSVVEESTGQETAFYSEDSAFARLLVGIIEGWLQSVLDDPPNQSAERQA